MTLACGHQRALCSRRRAVCPPPSPAPRAHASRRRPRSNNAACVCVLRAASCPRGRSRCAPGQRTWPATCARCPGTAAASRTRVPESARRPLVSFQVKSDTAAVLADLHETHGHDIIGVLGFGWGCTVSARFALSPCVKTVRRVASWAPLTLHRCVADGAELGFAPLCQMRRVLPTWDLHHLCACEASKRQSQLTGTRANAQWHTQCAMPLGMAPERGGLPASTRVLQRSLSAAHNQTEWRPMPRFADDHHVYGRPGHRERMCAHPCTRSAR